MNHPLVNTNATSTGEQALESNPVLPEVSEIALPTPDFEKVDPITALQDGIDSLSLSMFEALRGLRDAVAPESGNLGGSGPNNNSSNCNNPNNVNTNNTNGNPTYGLDSYEDFWQAYRNGDTDIVAMVRRVSPTPPTKNQDFIRIHSRLEMEKDAVLVSKLAKTVLEKSAIIDERVSSLPGMHRTKTEQMEYIQSLLEKIKKADERLANAYQQAEEQRDAIREFVMNNTSNALGIQEGTTNYGC